MEYKLLLVKRYDPRFHLRMTVETLDFTKEQHIQEGKNTLADDSIRDFMAALDQHFIVL